MGHDPFSPVFLAQINVICLPIARISKKKFRHCVEALKACALLPLKDSSKNGGEGGGSAARRWVRLNISDSHSKDGIAQMYPFEANREPQVAIGVMIDDEDLQMQSEQTAEAVRTSIDAFKQHVATYQHVIATAVLLCRGTGTEAIEDCIRIENIDDKPLVSAAMWEVVSAFQNALPRFFERLRSDPAVQSNFASSSRRLSISSNASGRVDSTPSIEVRSHEQQQQGSSPIQRETIAFGMLYLQAGQWSNALRVLSEGATAARAAGDYLWYARGLEGLTACMLLLVWSGAEFTVPQICFPSNDKHSQMIYSASMSAVIVANRANSISLFGNTSTSSSATLLELLPHLVSSILGLYERATNNIESTVPLAVLCEARIRWSKLLVVVSTYNGILSHDCVTRVVEGTQLVNPKVEMKTSGPALILPKTVLSQILMDAALEAQAKLDVAQATPLQLAIVNSFSILGIERKQGFHLKQFLQRLVPALLEARRRGAAELGIHPSANLPQFGNESSNEMLDPNRGIGALLQFIAVAYGLPITNQLGSGKPTAPLQDLRESLEFWHSVHSSGDIFMKLEMLGLCIEVADAIPEPRSSLLFSSLLLQASKRSVTVLAHQDDRPPLIASKDLPRLLQNMRNAAGAAESMGLGEFRSQYWDKFLVRNMALLEGSSSNRLMPHTAHDLSIAEKVDTEDKKDPFIFNPFAKPKVLKGDLVVTNGEMVYLNVSLQNPVDTEIELESISVLTEGTQFSATNHSIVLGPLCTQSFVLSGLPKESGLVKFTGCRATVKGCYQEDFLVLTDDWTPPRQLKQKSQVKSTVPNQAFVVPTPKTLTLKVIDPLPLLSVASTSLLQPSLMLLDGERTHVQVELRNESVIDIDFITLAFDDSVKQHLEEALGNKDLSPADTHEVQLQVIHKSAVRWLNQQSDLRIKAGKSHTFDLEILGKPGLTYVNVLVDYAYLGSSRSEVSGTFYTRQLNYSIATTVNGSVDIPRCMVLPFQGGTAWLTQNNNTIAESANMAVMEQQVSDGHDDRCMVLLDLRNIWPHPLEVEFKTSNKIQADLGSKDDGSNQSYTVSELLQPGQVTRVILLVPRIYIADARAPIPNLDTRRQFVVSVSKLSIEAEAASREAFWYREQLLRQVKAVWRVGSGPRTGEVDLRKGFRLTSRMIEALSIDMVDTLFTLEPDLAAHSGTSESDSVTVVGGSHYTLHRNRYAKLITKIHNRGDNELRLLLRLQPSLRNQAHNAALELSKRFIWSGTLHRALHPPLQAGETRDVELGIIVLAAGEYEVNGLVEEIRRAPSKTDGTAQNLGAGNERRIWHARQPCQIDVLDSP